MAKPTHQQKMAGIGCGLFALFAVGGALLVGLVIVVGLTLLGA